jgi:hypothetical protein
MQFRFTEFVDELIPGERHDIFNGGICFAELANICVQVLMIDQLYKLIIHYSFEIADAKVISGCRYL